jgi:hypothetical protein
LYVGFNHPADLCDLAAQQHNHPTALPLLNERDFPYNQNHVIVIVIALAGSANSRINVQHAMYFGSQLPKTLIQRLLSTNACP